MIVSQRDKTEWKKSTSTRISSKKLPSPLRSANLSDRMEVEISWAIYSIYIVQSLSSRRSILSCQASPWLCRGERTTPRSMCSKEISMLIPRKLRRRIIKIGMPHRAEDNRIKDLLGVNQMGDSPMVLINTRTRQQGKDLYRN